MDTVQMALWYIESHHRGAINLDDVSMVCGVSRYHLTRAFSFEFGVPLMRYVRRRKLSLAAQQLICGAEDILMLAVHFGYGSHEAFTRAFKDEFGITPEEVRSSSRTIKLSLTEPFIMKTSPLPKLAAPRLEQLPQTVWIGLVQRYPCNSPAGIPDQWQRFLPYLAMIEYRADHDAYGICFNFDDAGSFEYMTGVKVSRHEQKLGELAELKLSEQRFAVFSFPGHISQIRSVISAIWNEALAKSGLESTPGPMLERYGAEFDPRTGLGGFEIWVSVK